MALKFSAVINCFNEEDFIEYAITSISEHCDEIVVVDNCSKDNTVLKIKSLCKKNKNINEKVQLFALNKPKQLADARNFGIEQATNDWIIKWDGDFCAYSDSDSINEKIKPFSELINLIERTYENYDIYLLHSLNICGDLYHFDKTRKYLGLSGDSFIGRKDCMSYGVNEKYGDVGILRRPDGRTPRFFRLNDPERDPMFFLHIYGVKNDEYLLYRRFLSEFQVWVANNAHIDFWEWMREVKDYDKESGVIYVQKQLLSNMEKHDLPLPSVLEPAIESPKYLIEYDNGIPVNRQRYIK
ncbi:glycosyltransferase family 2 protein [Alteromonas sp. CyTr2]|uniref:glycosyltransferase family 2 protein n=1 Tax=Alteromonas sp. CyTr2 TaxID=2935039 RepID=UPI00248F08ED|nr:glycosyltransferase family 2 protein [Alteromonas sp. CyTr2]